MKIVLDLWKVADDNNEYEDDDNYYDDADWMPTWICGRLREKVSWGMARESMF